MQDLTGQVLAGRYQVEAFLGSGGMAGVYRVLDRQRAVTLAVKVLHPPLAADPLFMGRFEREAQALERLQHPHIVRFYGLVQDGPHAFILMDHIDGLTLQREISLSKDGMRPGRVLQIAQPVCAALYYAHQQGLVHCDIKSSNIMIHRNGTVYLTDFGIARTRGSTEDDTPSGTPAYMAPEHLAGQEPTPAADIYALGVVLYEMLTGGQRPFHGDSAPVKGSPAQKIAWEKNNLPAPSPRSLRPDLSPELELVVLRCLEKDPAARFPSALHLMHALEVAVRGAHEEETNTMPNLAEEDLPAYDGYQDDKKIVAGPLLPAPSRRLRLPRVVRLPWRVPGRRASLVPWMVGGIFLLALIGLGLALRGGAARGSLSAARTATSAALAVESTRAVGGASLSPSTATPRTSLPAATPTLAAATPAMPPIETSTPAATPFGGGPGSAGWIAFASDRGGTLQIWVMDGSGEQRRQVTNAAKGACQPAWAPGGALLAYITPCSGPRITYPGANIEYIDLASGEVTRLNLPAGGFDPAWSPDGKTLAYTKIINGNSVIYTYSLETKSERALAASLGKNMHPAWSPDGHYIAYTSLDRGVDEIWRMRADGSSQELLTQAGLLKYFSQPAWSPDGQTILAVLKELNVNGQRLVQIDPDAPRRPEEPFYQGDPLPETLQMERGSYSPDGLWVVYWSMLKGNNMEIIRVGVDGSVENLTSHQARDFQPDWAKP